MLFCTLSSLSPFVSPGSCQAFTHRACPQQRLSSSRHSIVPRAASTFSYARRPREKLITAMITTKQFKTVCSLATPFAGETRPRVSWCWFPGRRIFLRHHSYWRNSTEGFWGVLCYVCLSVCGSPGPMWKEYKLQFSRHTSQAPSLFVEQSPFLAQGDAAGLSSLPGEETLL